MLTLKFSEAIVLSYFSRDDTPSLRGTKQSVACVVKIASPFLLIIKKFLVLYGLLRRSSS